MGSPHIALRRESLWLVPIARDANDRHVLADRRGQLALSTYALYSDVLDLRDFDAFVTPVLRSLAASRSRSMLVLGESTSTFDAGRVRQLLQGAHERGIVTMVEISGTWPSTLLELLAAADPRYIRLAPELVAGAATLPDVFRSLVMLSEFAHGRALDLVARNPRDEHDLDAVRAAGISLVQWCDSPMTHVTQRPRSG